MSEEITAHQRKRQPGGKYRFFHLWECAWKEAVEGDEEAMKTYLELLKSEGFGLNHSYLIRLKYVLKQASEGIDVTYPLPPFNRPRSDQAKPDSQAAG